VSKPANVTPAMITALAKLERQGVSGLGGRMGEALVRRGLASVENSRDSVYPVRRYGEGRWGRVRRDYTSYGYKLTAQGHELLKQLRRSTDRS
jgi:hypothetical protein